MILHPLEYATPVAQKRWFMLLCIATILVMVALNIVDIPLKTAVAPMGIVSFELAGELTTAQAMVRSWNHNAQIYAGFSLGFDYLFMVLYSTTIALACVMAVRRFNLRWRMVALVGSILAWGQWVAAILDGVENYALFVLLLGSKNPLWPEVAWWCAIVKFSLVMLGIGYSLMGAGFTFFQK
jgi:hypothetical protein